MKNHNEKKYSFNYNFFLLEMHMSLNNLLEEERAGCLSQIKHASDDHVWDVFLKVQVELFFESELSYMIQEPWWSKISTVLEVGSGNGTYLHRLSRQFQKKKFLGLEKIPARVGQANDHYASGNLIFQEG